MARMAPVLSVSSRSRSRSSSWSSSRRRLMDSCCEDKLEAEVEAEGRLKGRCVFQDGQVVLAEVRCEVEVLPERGANSEVAVEEFLLHSHVVVVGCAKLVRGSIAAAAGRLELCRARARRGERLEAEHGMRRRHEIAEAVFVGCGLDLEQARTVRRGRGVFRVTSPAVVKFNTDIGLCDITKIH